MLNDIKLAAAAILLVASTAGASAQTANAANDYEPTGTAQGLWTRSDHAHKAPATPHHTAIKPGPNVVIENGQYLGQDPDPNVRLMLERDLSWL